MQCKDHWRRMKVADAQKESNAEEASAYYRSKAGYSKESGNKISATAINIINIAGPQLFRLFR